MNQTLTVTLYKGEGASAVGDIVVGYDGRTYPVNSSAKGTVTVRGTTKNALTAPVSKDAPEKDAPGVTVDEGTVFAVNGGDVEGALGGGGVPAL